MRRSLIIAGLVLCFAFVAAATAPYVTVTGVLQGPNGLPVANDVISFTPSQVFFVAGTGQIPPVTSECATSIDGSVVGTPNPLNPPQVSAVYTGTLSSGNYYVEESWLDASSNQTLVSPEVSIQLTGTGQIQELPPASGLPATVATRNIYIGTTSGSETLQGSVAGSGTYIQSVPLVTGSAVPSTNTTVCQVIANDAGWPTGTGYSVSLTTPAGGVLPGYPMQWQLLGPGGTINLSQGLPLYNGTVIYPSPILASPYNHSAQSISGPLNLSYKLNATGGGLLSGGFTINPTTLDTVQYADQYASVQAAINALPSTGGTVYLPCPYSGTWPTANLSNLRLVSLCPPANNGTAGSFSVSPNVIVTQVTLSSSSCITLTEVQNLYVDGVTIVQPANCSFTITSSQFNWFVNDTLMGPNGGGTGGTSAPAMIWNVTNGTCGPGCNMILNHFVNFGIICNYAGGQYCNYALQVTGAGVTNSGSVSSDNYVDGLVTGGNVQNGIDIELNTDSNHWRAVFLHTDIPGGGTCGVTANQSVPTSDIDADANDFTAMTISPGFADFVCLGQSNGNSFEFEAAANFSSQVVNILGGAPFYTAHLIGFFGWPGSYSSVYFLNTPTTFSKLQGCTSAAEGALAAITDSTVNAWGNTVCASGCTGTGGGSDHVGLRCNGTHWTVYAQ